MTLTYPAGTEFHVSSTDRLTDCPAQDHIIVNSEAETREAKHHVHPPSGVNVEESSPISEVRYLMTSTHVPKVPTKLLSEVRQLHHPSAYRRSVDTKVSMCMLCTHPTKAVQSPSSQL